MVVVVVVLVVVAGCDTCTYLLDGTHERRTHARKGSLRVSSFKVNFRRSPCDVLYLQCSRRERLVGIAIEYRVEAEGASGVRWLAGWLAGRVRDNNAADQQLRVPPMHAAALSDGRRKDVSFEGETERRLKT